MKKDQLLTLLSKIRNHIDHTNLTEWPAGMIYEMRDRGRTLHRIDFNTKRCNIYIRLDLFNDKIYVKFEVGNNFIESYHKLPMYGLKWTSLIWRQWRKLSIAIAEKDEKAEKVKQDKKNEEQIEMFNNLFYSSFPEEIDDIFFKKDND
jgi:hypothetical protein